MFDDQKHCFQHHDLWSADYLAIVELEASVQKAVSFFIVKNHTQAERDDRADNFHLWLIEDAVESSSTIPACGQLQ